MSAILIVDDDRALCRSLEIQFQLLQHEVRSAFDACDGLALAKEFVPDLLLLDINLPGQSGLSALPDFRQQHPDTPVIIMTGEPGNHLVVEAMRNGAEDYIRKPFELEKIFHILKTYARDRKKDSVKLEQGQDTAEYDAMRPEMIGSHPAMMATHKTIGLLSRSRVTVLIHGESGTGKELAARILHEATTPGRPFVGLNCSAVVPTLLESELFGHEKGAFTGADKVKIGKFEYADDGTVFLDEIGDMPLDLQGKLLRVLQEEEFVRVGGLNPILLKARIVGATHYNLAERVREGAFREDLFYRLSVSSIEIPPLRERREDIPMLAEYLLRKINRKLSSGISSISDDALSYLTGFDWPGNVRELENVLTRAVALAKNSQLTRESFEFIHQAAIEKNGLKDVPLSLADAEKQHIEKILVVNKWNITHSAKMLSISPTTLRKKIADYNLEKIR